MAELEDVLLGKEAEVTADAVSEAVVKAAAPCEENAGETSCDPKPEAEKPCEKACEPAPKEEAPKEITFTKKVISERDIIEANREGVKVIRISERNILTALAKDAASARNIQLIRE